MNAAIYARVSTLDQEPENQLQEVRRYCAARGWKATEFVDRGVSGAKDKRPALDVLIPMRNASSTAPRQRASSNCTFWLH